VAKSISHETTFGEDIGQLEDLRTIVLHQAEDVSFRLRRHDLYARTVQLKLRQPDFSTFTRATTLDEPTQLTDDVCRAALSILDTWWKARPGPLRLIGVGAGNLVSGAQVQHSLFESDTEQRRRLDRAVDGLRQRFGSDAVRRRTPRRG
jgi:DNA polymerase-4